MQIDTKRAFGSKQKSALLFKSNNHCSICNEPIKKDDEVEFNHNHPHSLGGRTDVTNGAVVHKSCNRKLGSKFPELQNIKLRKWQKEGTIAKNLELEDAIVVAAEKNLINETVAERMNKANELRKKAIAVDNFAPGEL